MTDETFTDREPDDAQWEALARYLAGELPPDEAVAVRAWIAADPARASLAEALAADTSGGIAAIAPAPVVDVEAALRRVSARIDDAAAADGGGATVTPIDRARRRDVPRSFGRRTTASAAPAWRGTTIRAAAVVAFAAAAGTLWQATRDRGPEAKSYATVAGQRDSLHLPDGTRVVLAPGSRMQMAAGYGHGTRDVTLEGQAYFEVTHDARHPFTVHAGNAAIRDVGTAFVVRHDAGAAVEVSVTAGVVELRSGESSVRLDRGDRGVLEPTGELRAERRGVTSTDLAWSAGQILFKDATFERVRADVRRWYGVELRAADSTLSDRRVTASFFASDSVAHVTRVLGLALGADVARRGDTVVFTPR